MIFASITPNAVVLQPSQHTPADHVYAVTLLAFLSLLFTPFAAQQHTLYKRRFTMTRESPIFTWLVQLMATSQRYRPSNPLQTPTERFLCVNLLSTTLHTQGILQGGIGLPTVIRGGVISMFQHSPHSLRLIKPLPHRRSPNGIHSCWPCQSP